MHKNIFQFNQETIRQPDDSYFESPKSKNKSSENISAQLNSNKKETEDKMLKSETPNHLSNQE